MSHSLPSLLRSPKLSFRIWSYRLLFWSGALVVALVAMVFASASTWGNEIFARAIAMHPLLAFVISPVGFGAALWVTRTVFVGAEGSGIPQVIAALKLPELDQRRRVLSLRIAVGKIVLTTVGLCAGASIGREGPTVQIGAAVLHTAGRWISMPVHKMERSLILAGGAAGIAAAFNTPLAGIVFAIEELSRSFEESASGTMLTAVIVAGIASLGIIGNYTYFGHTDATLSLAASWKPVLICGGLGGLLGGGFSRILILFGRGFSGRFGAFVHDRPVIFAALCGLGLAILGALSHHTIYGTGYEEAKGLVEGTRHLPALFGLFKLGATILSYISGIPGGIFAPSLAVGAGLGDNLSVLMPAAPVGAVVILSMCGYFTGVVQAPITAVVIVMEMTDNQSLTVALLATALVAYAASRLVCPTALYGTLAETFLTRATRPARAGTDKADATQTDRTGA